MYCLTPYKSNVYDKHIKANGDSQGPGDKGQISCNGICQLSSFCVVILSMSGLHEYFTALHSYPTKVILLSLSFCFFKGISNVSACRYSFIQPRRHLVDEMDGTNIPSSEYQKIQLEKCLPFSFSFVLSNRVIMFSLI